MEGREGKASVAGEVIQSNAFAVRSITTSNRSALDSPTSMNDIAKLCGAAAFVLASVAFAQTPAPAPAPAAAAAAPAASAGDPVKGREKTQMCEGCHEIPGWRTAFPEVYRVPKIAGQHEAYLASA